jgi:hypothetical protein
MPNNHIIRATHTCELDLPGLPQSARLGHIFSDFAHALLSIPVLADHDCITTFDKHTVTVRHNDTIILRGHRDTHTGMWKVPLTAPSAEPPTTTTNPYSWPNATTPDTAPTQHSANSAYHAQTKSDLVRFLHGAAGFPVPSTWAAAVDAGHYTTWPGLTAALINKHLPKSEATIKGHMQQQRQNIRSTQPKAAPTDATTPDAKCQFVYAAIVDATGRIDTDLTGRFPVTASSGNKYIFLLYDYDSSAIIVEAISSRSDKEILRAYNKLHQYLVTRGCQPKLQRMDNEASAALKRTIREKDMEYQIAPPHMHRRLAAERAIQTFKNHFVAILCGTDPGFPTNQWDKLLAQTQLTLNLLRTARVKPQLSAEAYLNGPFDYNKTPIAPTGHQGHCARKTQTTGHMGPARCRWLVHRTSHGTLPMLSSIHSGHSWHSHRRYCGILTNHYPDARHIHS